MTIKRTIDGTEHEITLTVKEMMETAWEMGAIWDKEDIDQYFEDNEKDFELLHGMPITEAEKLKPRMAELMRQFIDEGTHSFPDARELAVDEAIYEFYEREGMKQG